jgi:hypothetical protein
MNSFRSAAKVSLDHARIPHDIVRRTGHDRYALVEDHQSSTDLE